MPAERIDVLADASHDALVYIIAFGPRFAVDTRTPSRHPWRVGDANGSETSDAQMGRDLARSRAEQESLRELVRLIAHDLNNPLQSITLILELLELDLQGTDSLERVHQCAEGAALMRLLVRNLGEIAREVQEDDLPSVKDTVDSALGVLRRRLDRNGIELARDTEGLAGRRLASAADASALRWTLVAALLAAIDAAANGPASRHRLSVEACPAGLRLAIVAADPEPARDPAGLDPERQRRLVDACAGSSLSVSVEGAAITVALPT
jgi:signal transduction histidine kinase